MALSYVQQNGLETDSNYPYQAHAYACRNNPDRFHARISGHGFIWSDHSQNRIISDETMMTMIMNNGPIGVALDASGSDFAQYRWFWFFQDCWIKK